MDMANETIPESAKAAEWKGLVSATALEKPNNKVKKLSALTFDPDIQQRAGGVNPATAERYAKLIADGVKFPRIKAVKEGDTFWVWDGFTRGAAYEKAGVEEVEIYYTIGTKRDAEFLSFSANADHGEPRPPGTARRIIEKIFADKAWGKVGAKAIAEHVGVGQRYVEKVAQDLREGGEPSALGGRSDSRTVVRDGKTHEQKVGGPKPKTRSKTGGEGDDDGGSADFESHERGEDGAQGNGEAKGDPIPSTEFKPVTDDKVGNPIERDDVRDVFTRAPIIDDLLKSVRAIRKEVVDGLGKEKAEKNAGAVADPLFACVYAPGAMGDLSDLENVLKNARPYALCPRHAQDDVSRESCKWCEGRGWVGKTQYAAAVAAMNAPEKQTA